MYELISANAECQPEGNQETVASSSIAQDALRRVSKAISGQLTFWDWQEREAASSELPEGHAGLFTSADLEALKSRLANGNPFVKSPTAEGEPAWKGEPEPEGGAEGDPLLLDLIMEGNWWQDTPEYKAWSAKWDQWDDLKNRPPHQEKLERAVLAKAWAKRMVPVLDKIGLEDRARKIEECGSQLTFRDYFISGTSQLRFANFCQQTRLCVGCAHARSAKLVGAYTEKAAHLLTENPTWLPRLITLTIPNGPDLKERFNFLTDGLTKLRQVQKDSKRRSKQGSLSSLGAVAWSVEIKRGSGSGEWHPHVHGLALGPDRIDLDHLQEEWNKISLGSHRPDVRLLKSGRRLRLGDSPAELVADGTLTKELCEVFKYQLKLGELSPEDTISAWEVIHGKRLLRQWGGFHGCKVPEGFSESDDEDGPYAETVYQWLRGQYSMRSVFFSDEEGNTAI